MGDNSLKYGLILAGGLSSRMSLDKREILLDGRRLVEIAIENIKKFSLNPVLVVSDKNSNIKVSEEVSVIKDLYENYGPLGGIHSFLQQYNESALVIACDTPFIGGALLEGLINIYNKDIWILHYKMGNYIEPLPGIFSPGILPFLENAFSFSNRVSCREMFASLPENKWKIIERPVEFRDFFFNINTAEDLMNIKKYYSDNPVKTITALKYNDNPSSITEDIVDEVPFEIYINGISRAVLMCSPADMNELATGYAISEGYIDKREVAVSVINSEKGIKAIIETDKIIENESMKRVLTSGCGSFKSSIIINAEKLQNLKIDNDMKVKSNVLSSVMDSFQKSSSVYLMTGGVHSAALALDNEIRYYSFDIGRHNAVDKVVGKAILKKDDPSRYVLYVSGRISFEMVQKALRHGISILVSRSASTYLAVQMARETNLTLVSFARGKRFTIYSGEQRIIL
ncbi:MAG: formate dehydrogenase accessory sulfurtransferase FdhD [Candidatus Coatesbacteria bacterium]|nr:formate dehydrogenase accessory sulfurtransferase FdhD [Candidatus Coatesbacteria bacterium]